MTLKEARIAFIKSAVNMTHTLCKIAPLARMIGVCSAAAARLFPFGTGLVPVGFSALKNWFSELNLPSRSAFLATPKYRGAIHSPTRWLGRRFRIVTAAT